MPINIYQMALSKDMNSLSQWLGILLLFVSLLHVSNNIFTPFKYAQTDKNLCERLKKLWSSVHLLHKI